jgi:hypothetical protein
MDFDGNQQRRNTTPGNECSRLEGSEGELETFKQKSGAREL